MAINGALESFDSARFHRKFDEDKGADEQVEESYEEASNASSAQSEPETLMVAKSGAATLEMQQQKKKMIQFQFSSMKLLKGLSQNRVATTGRPAL